MNEVFLGANDLEAIKKRFSELPEPVLVVTGDASYELSGAHEQLTEFLRDKRHKRFSVTAPLPGPGAIIDWIGVLGDDPPGSVVGVGGGRVIDCAKLIALSATNEGILESADATGAKPAVPIVAVPTTAGSGSERTPFAVSYRKGVKYSVEHPSLLPFMAIVIPDFTKSMSQSVTAATGLDALTHSIESCWAVGSTTESRSVSLSALAEIWPTLRRAVEAPSPGVREVMAFASSNAGQAIATARTTAAHALSYSLTSDYGVAHGAAAAVTLGPLLRMNSEVSAENCQDPRGAGHVRSVVRDICEVLGHSNPHNAAEEFQSLLAELPVPSNLSAMGVRFGSDRARLARSVNPERLGNNPRVLGFEDLVSILESAG
ncbi:MAG: iron-containing alcohol dehydrogenase [Acidimicrobiia bacterium]